MINLERFASSVVFARDLGSINKYVSLNGKYKYLTKLSGYNLMGIYEQVTNQK